MSKLHCQDCQRGRPTTSGSYMSISVVIDWSHCLCIWRPMTGLPHPFTSPPTSLSFCLGLVVGVRVFGCLYMVGVVSTIKVHLVMAPDAVVLNLHTDALEVICNSEYQRRRPTTGITVALFCTSCRTDTAYPDSISVMEKAALHRMATSIAQLTLCQVASEEIETATKLLEKAGQKLRGISDVPPQRIADLDNATTPPTLFCCLFYLCHTNPLVIQSYHLSCTLQGL